MPSSKKKDTGSGSTPAIAQKKKETSPVPGYAGYSSNESASVQHKLSGFDSAVVALENMAKTAGLKVTKEWTKVGCNELNE